MHFDNQAQLKSIDSIWYFYSGSIFYIHTVLPVKYYLFLEIRMQVHQYPKYHTKKLKYARLIYWELHHMVTLPVQKPGSDAVNSFVGCNI